MQIDSNIFSFLQLHFYQCNSCWILAVLVVVIIFAEYANELCFRCGLPGRSLESVSCCLNKLLLAGWYMACALIYFVHFIIPNNYEFIISSLVVVVHPVTYETSS